MNEWKWTFKRQALDEFGFEAWFVMALVAAVFGICLSMTVADGVNHWAYVGPSYSPAEYRQIVNRQVRLVEKLRARVQLPPEDRDRLIAEIDELARMVGKAGLRRDCPPAHPL
jgi:hypothetical protein